MKYLIIIVSVVAFASAGLTGYLYLNPDYLSGAQSQSCPMPAPDPDARTGALIKQLQDELFRAQKTAHEQALEIAQLKSNNARIDDFYAKLKELQMTLPGPGKPGPGIRPSAPEFQPGLSEALSGAFSPEFFQNPEYARLFVSKVEEVIKAIEEKKRAEQEQRRAEQEQRRLAQRLETFAKAQNLNEFQTQELSRIVAERAAKSMELFSQMRPSEGAEPQLTREQMRAQMDTLRTESNEKVKQILLPTQFEEYQKIEKLAYRRRPG